VTTEDTNKHYNCPYRKGLQDCFQLFFSWDILIKPTFVLQLKIINNREPLKAVITFLRATRFVHAVRCFSTNGTHCLLVIPPK